MKAVIALIALAAATPAASQSDDLMEQARELYLAGDLSAAAEVFERFAASSHDDEAASAYNNACVLQTQVGELARALENCEQALERRRAADDRLGEARALNNLALVHQRAGRIDDARQAFEAALALNRESGDLEGEVINHLNLGVISSMQGLYDAALRSYRTAENLAAASSEAWAQRQMRIARQNQGSVLEVLDAHEEALSIYLDLLRHPDELDRAELAIYQLNAGVVYRNLGDAVEAAQRIGNALSLFEQMGDLAGAASAHLNLGLVQHHGKGDSTAGVTSIRRAVELATAAADLSVEIESLSYLANVLIDSSNFEAADQALEQLARLAETEEPAEASWMSRLGAARLARARGADDEAIDQILDAVRVIEHTGGGLRNLEDRARFLEHRREAYRLAVEWLVTRGGAHPPSLDAALAVALGAKARDLTERLQIPLPTPESFDIEELQTRLGGWTLVEVFDLGDRFVRFTLSRQGLEGSIIEAREELVAAAIRARRRLAAGNPAEAADLHLLANHLLAGLEGIDRVAIAPVDALTYLPWELLPHDAGLLIESAEVTYLPSASMLLTAPLEPGAARLRWLSVVADPPAHRQPELAPLPQAEREATLVGKWLGGRGQVLQGKAATVDEFVRQLRERGADVVHIAAHTVIDERPGSAAELLLSDRSLTPSQIASEKFDSGLVVLAACSTRSGSDPNGRTLHSLGGAWWAAGAEAVLATLWDVDDETTFAFMEQFYAELARGVAPAAALANTKRRLARHPDWQVASPWAAYVLQGRPDAAPIATPRFLAETWTVAGVGAAIVIAVLLLRRRFRES